MSHKNTKH